MSGTVWRAGWVSEHECVVAVGCEERAVDVCISVGVRAVVSV